MRFTEFSFFSDVTKLGNNQRNQYASPNQTFNSKLHQPYGQTYQPLQQNQPYQPNQSQPHMVQNQAYQRNTSHYAATTQIPYQGYNKGSLNDINQSPYHQPGPAQPPNYQETINNLYHRQQEQNHYQSKDQLNKYANPAKLQSQSGYSNYNTYSNENSPIHHQYGGGKPVDYNGYTTDASQNHHLPMEGMNGISNYNGYDLDLVDEYNKAGDEYGYARTNLGMDPIGGSKTNLQYSDPDLTLAKVHS